MCKQLGMKKMDRKTILNNELAQNCLQIKSAYKTFWVLETAALLLSREEASLLIFIAVLARRHASEEMMNEKRL